MQIVKREFPRRLTEDDLDEIAVFACRVAEGLLILAKTQPPAPATPEFLSRRLAYIDGVRRAENRVIEIKRAGGGRLAAAVARLKAKNKYGEHPETGVLSRGLTPFVSTHFFQG